MATSAAGCNWTPATSPPLKHQPDEASGNGHGRRGRKQTA
jgi:hypothetical protein